jgi:hypothetical protein
LVIAFVTLAMEKNENLETVFTFTVCSGETLFTNLPFTGSKAMLFV